MKKNRKRTENSPNGWVLLNKPIEMGSTDCVNILKRMIRETYPDIKPKVGHAGTLDPLASGVLILALGDATKLVDYVMHCEKTYVFRAIWGEARDTDDAEGKVIATSEVIPSRAQVEAVLPDFTGIIQQVPPKFSAVKIAGKRAYDLARDGQEFEIQEKEVIIHHLGIISHGSYEEAGAEGEPAKTVHYTDFVCECGKGTYVRSLARDIARQLGTCAYVGLLERSRLGKCGIGDTISLDLLDELVHNGTLDDWLVPMAWMLDDIPAWSVPEALAKLIKHGNAVRLIPGRYPDFLDELGDGEIVQVLAQGRLLALCVVEAMELKPTRVFNW